MTRDFNFHPELKGVAQRAHTQTVHRDRYGDPNRALQAMAEAAIHERCDAVRQKAKEHLARNGASFIEREYQKLRRENPLQPMASLARGPKPPPGAPTIKDARDAALRQRAESNVNARHYRRLATIQIIERRMVRAMDRERSRTLTR